MVRRDIEFRNSLKKRKNGKHIDIKVHNTGNLQDLQKIADDIYSKKIGNTHRREETIRERYGGYKTKPINKNRVSSRVKTERNSNRTR